MLHAPFIWLLAVQIPALFSGRALHRAGLHAIAAGAYPAAAALLERAAARYRKDLEVEALARLRVHELIARARATGAPGRDEAALLEVEQRLTRLERIESLAAPFELVPASRLLATWMQGLRAASVAGDAARAPGGTLPNAA